MVPGIGALAYVVVELVPEWLGTYQGQKARARIGRALNPEKTYRALKDELEIADTIANREALAEECVALGRFDEAREQYDAILTMPLGEEPGYMLGRARAEFGLGRFADARATTICAAAGPIGNPPTAICSMPAPSRMTATSTRRSPNITHCPPIMRAPSRGCATASHCASSAARLRPAPSWPTWCCA
jgi:hypothetical protein